MASDIEQAFEAVRTGDANLLSDLIAKNPTLASSRGDNGVSLLLTACYYRRPDMVQILLVSTGPLDIFEASAVEGGAERVAALLDEAPALAGAVSADGFTPLHLASYFGQEGTAEALLERGASPEAVSRNAMALRPLHSAAASRSLGIVKMLVERGAEVNARQHGGWTPLHAAAFNGDLPMAEYLVTHGADVALKTDDGKTSLDIAVEKGRGPFAEWLRGFTPDHGHVSLLRPPNSLKPHEFATGAFRVPAAPRRAQLSLAGPLAVRVILGRTASRPRGASQYVRRSQRRSYRGYRSAFGFGQRPAKAGS